MAYEELQRGLLLMFDRNAIKMLSVGYTQLTKTHAYMLYYSMTMCAKLYNRYHQNVREVAVASGFCKNEHGPPQ